MRQRRAWITGIGVVSALGPRCDDFLGGLLAGRSGIRQVTLFETTHFRSSWAAEAPTPALPASLGPFRRCSRADLLGLQAAAEAVEDATLEAAELAEAAVLIGTGAGGAQRTADYQHSLAQRGEHKTPAAWLISHQPANAVDLIANRLGACGPRCSLMTACSSSATALGLGLDMIRLGRARRVLAGGAESLSLLTYGGFNTLRAMDDQPCRPFHAERRGLTLGEGAAVLCLEEAELAAARGAVPYAELGGYGVSADAHHLTAPDPEGRGAILAMEAALRDAGIQPQDVQYINAHGTATHYNDPIEVQAIRRLFGAHADRLAVSSTKAMTGHTLGAAGAIEAAACALAIHKGFLPPTLRLDRPDPACDLDLVPQQARSADLAVALTNSFAFGGNNTSLVLRRIR